MYISLLNDKGKIFFSIHERSLIDFVQKNNYTDTFVQQGGCKMYGVVLQLLKEVKKKKKSDIAVLCLDLINDYGSIPHKLMKEALKRYHVLNKTIKLIWIIF